MQDKQLIPLIYNHYITIIINVNKKRPVPEVFQYFTISVAVIL